MKSSVTTRRATREELPAVAALHRLVFSETMGVALGEGYTSAFLNWFLEEARGSFLIAKRDEELVGYAIGAPIGRERERNHALLRPALAGLLRRPRLAFEPRVRAEARTRIRVLLAGDGHQNSIVLPQPSFSLVGIGVAPQARGHGIAQRLLASFLEDVRSMGARSLRLSVYDNNERARRLYEGHGFSFYRHPMKANVLFYWKAIEP